MKSGEVRFHHERRVHRRYPLILELEYVLADKRGSLQPGRGRTVNLSSGGVLFQPDRPIPAGVFKAQLAVRWPARPDGTALQLVIHGYVVRRAPSGAISVALWRHKFKTAAHWIGWPSAPAFDEDCLAVETQ